MISHVYALFLSYGKESFGVFSGHGSNFFCFPACLLRKFGSYIWDVAAFIPLTAEWHRSKVWRVGLQKNSLERDVFDCFGNGCFLVPLS